MNAEQLSNAFELFNQHSDTLERSYRELQVRVETLTDELTRARSARLEELIEKERLSQRLSLLLETLPGAIIVLDGNGVIHEQNTEAVALLNEPLSGCAWSTIVSREVRAGGSQDGNIQLRDGRWLSLSRRPLKTEPGEILLLADITESRQIAELRERQQRLSTIGKMTAEFAHQVRTPLASAMLYASQLTPDTPAAQRIVGKISERLNDLGRMVNDMLGFAGGGKRADETIHVHDLLEATRTTLEAQLGAASSLDVLVDGSPLEDSIAAAGGFSFAGNADALRGALINLVTNADQAGSGGASIQLGAWHDDRCVYFTVTDDGPGIADDVLSELFKPFFTTRPQGTGLGLAVVHAVAQAHGGDVRVKNLRSGCRFTVRLPNAATDGEAGHV